MSCSLFVDILGGEPCWGYWWIKQSFISHWRRFVHHHCNHELEIMTENDPWALGWRSPGQSQHKHGIALSSYSKVDLILNSVVLGQVWGFEALASGPVQVRPSWWPAPTSFDAWIMVSYRQATWVFRFQHFPMVQMLSQFWARLPLVWTTFPYILLFLQLQGDEILNNLPSRLVDWL